ncbi:MAG: hypothetical protein GXP24_10620 [Planctomycetes bacterium]|nr:hypothetical protein [Planctomycetota bacterium]
MGIQVTCPNGHAFKVKDRYAGKKGLCPFCKGQVAVRVPKASTDDITKAAYRVAAEEHGGIAATASSSSVFDDSDDDNDPSASCSLMSSSVIRHNLKCKCGERVPMWFAKCPKCGHFFDHR